MQSQGILVQEQDPLIRSYDPNLWVAPKCLDGYDTQAEFFCTRCQQNRFSLIKNQPGFNTYTCCCCLCVLTFVLGLLPFYVSDCQDKHHICPVCSTYVNSVKYEYQQVGYKEFKPC